MTPKRYFVKWKVRRFNVIEPANYRAEYDWFDSEEERAAFIEKCKQEYGKQYYQLELGDNELERQLVAALNRDRGEAYHFPLNPGRAQNTDEVLMRGGSRF